MSQRWVYEKRKASSVMKKEQSSYLKYMDAGMNPEGIGKVLRVSVYINIFNKSLKLSSDFKGSVIQINIFLLDLQMKLNEIMKTDDPFT